MRPRPATAATLVLEPVRGDGLLARLGDWASLAKPRIAAFVVFAAFTGGLLGAGPGADLARVAASALLVGCVAGASAVFNQVAERDVDARMRRTAGRPLPAGRIGVRGALLLGTVLCAAGTTGLAVGYSPLAALLALSTLVAYALVYTPLKRASSLNTVVGAVPGAMPPLLGHVALAGEPGAWGWTLFGVLFVWQFPHFLAIAWLHRADYRRAGLRMLPALEGTEGLAGRQAFLYGLVLLPVSLLPGVRGDAGIAFTAVALVLGLGYAGAAGAFALRESTRTARGVLVASLLYLPLFLSATLLDPVVSLAMTVRLP